MRGTHALMRRGDSARAGRNGGGDRVLQSQCRGTPAAAEAENTKNALEGINGLELTHWLHSMDRQKKFRKHAKKNDVN